MDSSPLRVLVVNESLALLEVLEQLRASHGLDVFCLDQREELPELLKGKAVDVTLLGVRPTCMNPIDLLRELGATGAKHRVALVGEMHERVKQSVRLLADSVGVEVLAMLPEAPSESELAGALSRLARAGRRLTAEELRHALDEHQLTLHYQPKVACDGGMRRLVGVEGLVRWNHPELGLLLPGRFLRTADEAGMMADVTDFTLTHAIQQASLWHERGFDPVIAINLSPRLLKDAGFPDRLLAILREYDLPPKRLMLEVTEASTLIDRNLALDVFTRLRLAGIGLALDDFGTGFSSLTELYRMPFSEVKIDGTVIADVTRMPEAATIVRAIIRLAHELKISVSAEGVETHAALDFLVDAGCDTVQGQIICEPRSPHDLDVFLADAECGVDTRLTRRLASN
jgi:EAL domain-containing protein (putative c-di-GMP-specific phosphodiesterase class I)